MLLHRIPFFFFSGCNKNVKYYNTQTSEITVQQNPCQADLTLTYCKKMYCIPEEIYSCNVNKHEDEIIKLASEGNNLDLSELAVFKCSS